MKRFFLNEDKTLRAPVEWVLFFSSFGMMLLPWYFELPRIVCYVLFCVGSVLGSILAYSDRFGNKSFTKDPLGWRKAKESYEASATPQEDFQK